MRARFRLVVSCEHGGNRVPAAYRELFRGRRELLASHRGYDPGALELARRLARRFRCPLVSATVTRLLVELNRSSGHPAVFSEMTRTLGPRDKDDILKRFYHPHRRRLASIIARHVSKGVVAHVASHSFTPVLDGNERTADVAWLYDPARDAEKRFCTDWRRALARRRPDLRLRRNYPYRGAADGLTTHLRRVFPASRYLGIELEVNQAWVVEGGREWRRLRRAIADALAEALDHSGSNR